MPWLCRLTGAQAVVGLANVHSKSFEVSHAVSANWKSTQSQGVPLWRCLLGQGPMCQRTQVPSPVTGPRELACCAGYLASHDHSRVDYRYPSHYLPKLADHVATMQQKHEARKVARLEETAAARACSYDSRAASSWERVDSIGASAGKGAWKGTP